MNNSSAGLLNECAADNSVRTIGDRSGLFPCIERHRDLRYCYSRCGRTRADHHHRRRRDGQKNGQRQHCAAGQLWVWRQCCPPGRAKCGTPRKPGFARVVNGFPCRSKIPYNCQCIRGIHGDCPTSDTAGGLPVEATPAHPGGNPDPTPAETRIAPFRGVAGIERNHPQHQLQTPE